MDTSISLSFKNKRSVFNTVGLGIVLLLLSQCVISYANSIEKGYTTGLSPSLIYIKNEQVRRENKFNDDINLKYSNYIINDIDKGIKHVKMIRYYNNKPVRINVVELSTNVNNNLVIEPVIANKNLLGKTKIKDMATKKNAIVAINGGYFKPQSGVPLGTLMINKKVYTGPIYDRVAIGFFNDGYEMARIKLNASVITNIGGFKIDNVNQPRMLSTHTIVYTPDWGEISPVSPKYGAQLVVENGKIVKFTSEQNIIPKNGYVIIGPEKKLNHIANAKKIKLKIETLPEWNSVNHIISGGPYLVKNGEVFVDMTAQKLSAIGGRNPRTAIGYTADNNLILLTADGREGASVGLTLMELANLMKELGCINAMNLDGGGSTVMYINGAIVNKPAVQGGIPLSHSLTVKYKNIS